jgi:hypothetical protein
LAVTETGDVVLVAAEGGLCGLLVFAGVAGEFQLEGAELVVDDLPDDFVGGHGGLWWCAWWRVEVMCFSCV